MKKKTILLSIILCSIFFPTLFNFDGAEAYKTGGKYFCEAFPHYPDCVGWRTDPLSDSFNYWFCDYVDLPQLCENKPDSEKQIILRDQDFCCRFIGPELELRYAELQDNSASNQLLGADSPDTSIKPLIIWTDKDHYNFRDKVMVYGKFDFTSFSTKKNISEIEFDQTAEIVNGTSIQAGRIIAETPVLDVDIKLNGIRVLKNIPVNENGWFATVFYLIDRYHFSNQNNLLEVDYVQYDDVPLGGPKTHATYHFTTGDISKKDDAFEIWIDDTLLPNKIRYGVIVENPQRFIDLDRYNFVITRLITPNGYVIPVESDFAIHDLSVEYGGLREYDVFKEYGHGTYEIQITYGDNTSKKSFKY